MKPYFYKNNRLSPVQKRKKNQNQEAKKSLPEK